MPSPLIAPAITAGGGLLESAFGGGGPTPEQEFLWKFLTKRMGDKFNLGGAIAPFKNLIDQSTMDFVSKLAPSLSGKLGGTESGAYTGEILRQGAGQRAGLLTNVGAGLQSEFEKRKRGDLGLLGGLAG